MASKPVWLPVGGLWSWDTGPSRGLCLHSRLGGLPQGEPRPRHRLQRSVGPSFRKHAGTPHSILHSTALLHGRGGTPGVNSRAPWRLVTVRASWAADTASTPWILVGSSTMRNCNSEFHSFVGGHTAGECWGWGCISHTQLSSEAVDTLPPMPSSETCVQVPARPTACT